MTATARIRALAFVVAVAALGFCVGTIVSAPASAQRSDTVQIAMPSKGVGFTSGATPPMLDVRALVPGGAVGGVMAVRNSSGTPGDLSLRVVNTSTSTTCAGSGQTCRGAGAALKSALRFTMDISNATFGTPGAKVQHRTGTIADLQARSGMPIAVGVPDRGVRWVRLSAALPFVTGNAAQYGAYGFDLQIDLAGTAGISEHVVGPSAGQGNHNGGAGVLGTASTGVRAKLLLAGGGALLLAGMVLLLAGRRRNREYGTDNSR